MVETLVGVGGEIIVVYVDDVFVVLDGLFLISDSNAKQQDSSSIKPATSL